MKLKDGFVVYSTEDTNILVPTGGQQFSGLMRCNETAAFVLELLKKETSRDELADAMVEKYGIDRALAETDVESVLDMLRKIGALEE